MSSDLHEKITSVEVEDNEKEADRATINIETASVSDVGKVSKGKALSITMGYKNDSRNMFNGIVEKVEANFQESGVISITITAMDETVSKAGKEEKKKIYKDKTHTDIVKEIAKQNGWTVVADDTKKKAPQTTQDSLTDMQFIRRMADENGYEVWFEHANGKKELHFKKRKEEHSGVTLGWKTGNNLLLSLSITESDDKKKESADASVDPKKGKETKTDNKKKTPAKPKIGISS